MDVLRAAIDMAKKNNISTVVVASTTGNTALKLFELVKTENLQLIVVTHDEGKTVTEKRFNESIRNKLLSHNVIVYTHNPRFILLRKIVGKILGKFGFARWRKYLKEMRIKYGTGIKVCHIIVQMLMEGRILSDNRVIAIAGTKSGADSAAIFLIKPKNKWPILEEIIENKN